MKAQEAKLKSLENSKLYKEILDGIQKEIDNSKFEYIIYNDENFREWNDLVIAIVDSLRNDEFEVNYDKFTYYLTISWR
jgi:hypothetical protein